MQTKKDWWIRFIFLFAENEERKKVRGLYFSPPFFFSFLLNEKRKAGERPFQRFSRFSKEKWNLEMYEFVSKGPPFLAISSFLKEKREKGDGLLGEFDIFAALSGFLFWIF